jgi:hypothetical protein
MLSRMVADNLISIGGDKLLNRHKAYDALVEDQESCRLEGKWCHTLANVDPGIAQ